MPGQLPEERMRWIAMHVIPQEASLRRWLASRRLPGLEIDDIVQETYVRLIRVDDVSAIRNVGTYLRRTAWSVLVTHVRQERVIPLQMMADINELGLAADGPGPEQQAADRDELQHLAEAVANLPGKIGDVFRLRRVSGLSQRDAARELGLAESTVEKHMKKALTLLLHRFARGGNAVRDASMERGGKTGPTDDPSERYSGG